MAHVSRCGQMLARENGLYVNYPRHITVVLRSIILFKSRISMVAKLLYIFHPAMAMRNIVTNTVMPFVAP